MKALLVLLSLLLVTSATSSAAQPAGSWVIVSVADQRLMVIQQGVPVKTYAISTSKFGVGDRHGSYRTPLGTLEVAAKIGSGAPAGAVFKSRRFTGEILRPNAPGRDPIVTRILWLRGRESMNLNAYGRGVYIHGTPEERLIGRPASYGCIRMRSRDVIDLFDRIPVGTPIKITTSSISKAAHQFASETQFGRISG